MAGVTKDQTALIRRLTRRANRRIERAKGGQKTYLESIVAGGKFSAATKGMSQQQAAAQIRKLEKFLNRMSTTRVGWDWIRKEIVHKAAQTLSKQGYSITDEELAEILMQVDASDKTEYYRVINIVEAKKNEDPGWKGTAANIQAAIEEKISAQQALDRMLASRK
ncbi:MAG: hypothetical protein IJI87_03215 [Mogibacterium sp.]|nr:hypothetical protein [Mogibacterium sp.]